MKITLLSLFPVLTLFISPAFCQPMPSVAPAAAPAADSASLMDWMISFPGEMVQIIIETDMNDLVQNKELETYQPASITITGENDQASTWAVKVRPRGKSRKKMCFYPPLKVKFRKKDLEAAGLSRQFPSMRLVSQCEGSGQYQKYLIKEYLAYRLYNIVDTLSLRVKLVTVTYVDAAGTNKPFECLAIMIENEKELAARFNGKKITRDKFSYHLADRPSSLKMAAFQYMIGNTDFAIGNLHNLKLLALPELQNPAIIAYDFDFSGLVNAHYASPHSSLPISSTRERLYRGPSCTSEEIQSLTGYFLQLQPRIMGYCEQFPYLDKRSNREVVKFLEEFFLQMNDSNLIHQQFGGQAK